ncbi:oxidoreductase family, NAD-binding rossmann fold domain-containing protein [Trichoderma breve]|uniref:D-xylose 1-dehydrogenase (NADP(+), D-xylono-1,5-lactone-forming) n=1 Tax=Trichoderma breve TaxID=2034170 RepID=A0A9W9B9L6_9HYPO|nr:oxidoreductase family, NAD-binding rossmann fold domain-containing protein [Trichoderma breve]KAJ4859167.1 oxidoreductase family, NAD-binding rossmann fold domain-containing protein [Trichoderma breve]
MASGNPYTLKWGIMATGGIAETFCKDLLCSPAVRGADDVRHEIVAVASSSSSQRAAEFLQKINGAFDAKTYGSYPELVVDPNVDIIYVATPHSHHFQNTMLALEAGKHVLCEKAFTVTAAQARKLVETAKAKKLFLMEAVWTRYFPLSIKVRELITSGEIGTVFRTIGDLSINSNAEEGNGLSFADSHRMVNPDLAGEQDKEAPAVIASSNKYTTGADENTAIICSFPGHNSIGIASTTMRADTDPENVVPAVRIQGSKGEIQVFAPAYRPTKYRVVKKNGEAQTFDAPQPADPARNGWGHGMFWEADECARCLRDGKLESATLPWKESIVIMETMEEALRQGGITYPELITTDVYDPKSPLNTGNQ